MRVPVLLTMMIALSESLLFSDSSKYGVRRQQLLLQRSWDVNMDDDDTRIVMDSIIEQTLNNLYGRSRQGVEGPQQEVIDCSMRELKAYHKLYGNVLVPPHFVFPDDGSCSADLQAFHWEK